MEVAPSLDTHTDPGRRASARQALLDAAVEIFGESSLESATTREIAKRAGQNLAAIPYYYGSKEGLYLAVAEHIVQVMMRRIGPIMDGASRFLEQASQPHEECLRLLQRLLCASIANTETMVPVTSIIVREQTHPTKAFSIIYSGCLERLHALGARLIQAYLGDGAGMTHCVVRFHALLGEALAFRFARETILRRASWSGIAGPEEGLIGEVVSEHVELVLRGLRAQARRRKHPK